MVQQYKFGNMLFALHPTEGWLHLASCGWSPVTESFVRTHATIAGADFPDGD